MKQLQEWTAAFMVVLMVTMGATPAFAGWATDHQPTAFTNQSATADNSTSHDWGELSVAAPTCGNPVERMMPLMMNTTPSTVVGGMIVTTGLPSEIPTEFTPENIAPDSIGERELPRTTRQEVAKELNSKKRFFQDRPGSNDNKAVCAAIHAAIFAFDLMETTQLQGKWIKLLRGYNWQTIRVRMFDLRDRFCKDGDKGGGGSKIFTDALEEGGALPIPFFDAVKVQDVVVTDGAVPTFAVDGAQITATVSLALKVQLANQVAAALRSKAAKELPAGSGLCLSLFASQQLIGEITAGAAQAKSPPPKGLDSLASEVTRGIAANSCVMNPGLRKALDGWNAQRQISPFQVALYALSLQYEPAIKGIRTNVNLARNPDQLTKPLMYVLAWYALRGRFPMSPAH